MTKRELLLNDLRNITLETTLENTALTKWISSIDENEFDEIKEEMETLDFNITIYSDDCRELLNSVNTVEFCKWVNLYSQNNDFDFDFSNTDRIATLLVASVIEKASILIDFDSYGNDETTDLSEICEHDKQEIIRNAKLLNER